MKSRPGRRPANSILHQFEELRLLAVCRLPYKAYSLAIQALLEAKANRTATLGGIYRSLNRLRKKGFVRSGMGGVTRERGGKRKRFYERS